MLAIVNIDPNLRKTGVHRYSLRLNSLEICQFKHKREEPMSEILYLAATAVYELERKGDPVQMARIKETKETVAQFIAGLKEKEESELKEGTNG